MHNGGPWFIQRAGFFTFNSAPANLATVLPPGQELNPGAWNLAPLNPLARDYQVNFARNESDWTIDVPRPTYAIWMGDNWRVRSDLTINLGIRWDADPKPGVAAQHRHQQHHHQQRDSGQLQPPARRDERLRLQDRHPRLEEHRAARRLHLQRGRAERSRDPRRDRALLRLAGVERDVQPAVLQPPGRGDVRVNNGRSDFITNPTNGVTADKVFSGAVPLPAQTVRTIAPDFKSPYTWQSSIGFQKQINAVTGFDVDLTHWDEYRDTRTIDANLQYNPATGYNAANGAAPIRPNPAYGGVFQFTSDGKRDQTAIASEPHAPSEEQGPGRRHLDADARDEGQRHDRLRHAAGEQPVRLPRRRVGDVAGFPAQHDPHVGTDAAAVGHQHERHLLLRLGQPVPRQHRDRAVRQAGHEPPEPVGHRRRVAGDHHPGVGSGSVGRSGGHQLG